MAFYCYANYRSKVQAIYVKSTLHSSSFKLMLKWHGKVFGDAENMQKINKISQVKVVELSSSISVSCVNDAFRRVVVPCDYLFSCTQVTRSKVTFIIHRAF